MAGIQALVNQSTGKTQGNPAPAYYSLATGPYASMIFNPVTLGDITVNCSGTLDCYGATSESGHRHFNSPANGELSTSISSPMPAYSATPGWNFATGIGSVNAANLVKYWSTHQ
jgi:subtilase family serine protease